uniref:Odorant binding protein n=1 Tax=Dendrolimus houi TaxID=765132 RepID=A0A076E931_9NEOP|nr:odorant binding protein [Dendrolimus houi]
MNLDSLLVTVLMFSNMLCVWSVTRQQLKNSGKLLKKACMPKHDVTEEQVGNIDKGTFIEDRNVMCYIACIYSVGQAVKNDKIIHDAMIKQVNQMFPAKMKDAVKAAIENCRGVGKSTIRNKLTVFVWRLCHI